MKLHKTIVTNKGEVLTNPEDIIAYNLSSLLFCCINILYIIKNNTFNQKHFHHYPLSQVSAAFLMIFLLIFLMPLGKHVFVYWKDVCFLSTCKQFYEANFFGACTV